MGPTIRPPWRFPFRGRPYRDIVGQALLAGAVLLTWASPARAIELSLMTDAPPVEFHGFVSQGYLRTTANNYLARTRTGSFEFTEAALNATVPLASDLRTGMQLFTRELGQVGDYAVHFDWFYLDYHWKDWLGVRAGRVKLPFGLYNDTSDIDSARNPVLLPQAIYPTTSRDFLLAMAGVELYGYLPIRGAGAMDYRLYSGSIQLNVINRPGAANLVTDLRVPVVLGGRLLWETPLVGLRLGASAQYLELDTDMLVPDQPKDPAKPDGPKDPAGTKSAVVFEIPALLTVASLEYAPGDLQVAVEYARWFVSANSSNQALLKSVPETVSERAYAMAHYRINPWLQPGAYYSLYYRDTDKRDGRAAQAHDRAVTLRFDINPNWLVKLEAHWMYGTAALTPALNDNVPTTSLEPDWGLLAVKTTAYF